MKRLLLVLFSTFLISACSSLQGVQPYQQKIDSPQRGQTTTANLGDTLVSKGVRYTFDAIQTAAPLMKGAGLTAGYEIPPQKMPAVYEDNQYIYYQAQSMLSKDIVFGAMAANGGVCRSKTKPDDIGVYLVAGACVLSIKGEPVLTDTKVAAESRPTFVQELIYNGRSEDIVKFLYRELSNDLMRDAFSQDVQYDLNDGNVIGFKELRLEIIDASNTEITYRVLETFAD